MTRLGEGTLYFDKGDGQWEQIGTAMGVLVDAIRIQFDGLRFTSEKAAEYLEAFAALMRQQPHLRSPSRPFFPKRRGRSMKGK